MGVGELRNSVDENLAGRRTDGEWVGIPEDYVWGRSYHRIMRTEVSVDPPASYPEALGQNLVSSSWRWLTCLNEANPMTQPERLRWSGSNRR